MTHRSELPDVVHGLVVQLPQLVVVGLRVLDAHSQGAQLALVLADLLSQLVDLALVVRLVAQHDVDPVHRKEGNVLLNDALNTFYLVIW